MKWVLAILGEMSFRQNAQKKACCCKNWVSSFPYFGEGDKKKGEQQVKKFYKYLKMSLMLLFSVGPLQGAPSLRSHVRSVVVRSPRRLRKRKERRTLFAQLCQGLFILLQVILVKMTSLPITCNRSFSLDDRNKRYNNDFEIAHFHLLCTRG